MLGSTLAEPTGGNNVNEGLRLGHFGELVHGVTKPLICRHERATQALKAQRWRDIQLRALPVQVGTKQEQI